MSPTNLPGSILSQGCECCTQEGLAVALGSLKEFFLIWQRKTVLKLAFDQIALTRKIIFDIWH